MGSSSAEHAEAARGNGAARKLADLEPVHRWRRPCSGSDRRRRSGLLCQPAPRTPREACTMALLTARTRGGGRPARVSGCRTRCWHGAQDCCTRGRWAGAKGPICRLLQIRGRAYPRMHESAHDFGLVAEGEKPPSGCGRRGRSSRDYREHSGGRARRRAGIYRRGVRSDPSQAIHHLHAKHA